MYLAPLRETLNFSVESLSKSFEPICLCSEPYLESCGTWNLLNVEPFWNLESFKCETFLWNLCGTWNLLSVEPLCGTLGNLNLLSVKPGSRFSAAPP